MTLKQHLEEMRRLDLSGSGQMSKWDALSLFLERLALGLGMDLEWDDEDDDR